MTTKRMTTADDEKTKDSSAKKKTVNDNGAIIHHQSTASSINKRDCDIIRRVAAWGLLLVVGVCPPRWFFDQASRRPRVGLLQHDMVPTMLLPTPFSPMAILFEHAAEIAYVASLAFLLVAPKSRFFRWIRNASFLAVISWIVLELYDVTRAGGLVQHGLALLLICSLESDDNDNGLLLVAVRIATGGTWFWAGIHKINPSFLQSYSVIADPFMELAFGRDFFERNRIPLHFVAVATEAWAGLTLLVCSLPRSRQHSSLVVRINVILSVIFLASMNTMIVVRLHQMKWGYSAVSQNVQFAFLAVWLWRSWLWPQPRETATSISSESKQSNSRNGKIAVVASLIFFVLVPAGLMFGIVDPYFGVSLYSDNVPELWVEFPAEFSNLYRQFGFLEWGAPGWNVPILEAVTHDGRRVIRRNYIMMNAAVTGGHEGYSAIWAHQQYASNLCDSMRVAGAEEKRDVSPSHVGNDARFLLKPHLTGSDLFRSLRAMAFPDYYSMPPSPAILAQDGCRDEWTPLVSGARYHTNIFTISADTSEPVHIYRLGNTNGIDVRPEMWHVGHVVGKDDEVVTDGWAGTYFLATRGGSGRNYFPPAFSENEDVCALELFLITEGNQREQRFVIDIKRGGSGRTVPGLQACSTDRCPANEQTYVKEREAEKSDDNVDDYQIRDEL